MTNANGSVFRNKPAVFGREVFVDSENLNRNLGYRNFFFRFYLCSL